MISTPSTTPVDVRALGRRSRSSNVVVTAVTECPRRPSAPPSSRATGIGPPNATAGQCAGIAKRIRSRRSESTPATLASPEVSFARVTARRVRLLVLNQYYWPGLEATAHLLTELCEALAARGFDVTVVTGKVPGQPTGTSRRKVAVIPNWVDTAALTPQPRDNRWARRKGFVDRFVVMHSGNVGYAQDLDSLVRATTF